METSVAVVSFMGSSFLSSLVLLVTTAPRRGAHRSQQSPSGRIEPEDLGYEANEDRNWASVLLLERQ